MKQHEISDRAVREALDSCLSGLETLPSMRGDILRAARGESKVKRKINVGFVLAIVLVVMMGSVAVAAGLGIFGELGQREDADARLPGLESVSAVMDKTFTIAEDVTVTINQAYYDGSRVFISYAVAGNYDQVTLGEGDPGIASYDMEEPGTVYGEMYFSESASYQRMAAHLDGSAPRWAKSVFVNVHDGLQIGDTYLDIIGGDIYIAEDGTMIGWKECVVPAGLAADEVTFSLGAFTSSTTYYQTADFLYTAIGPRSESTWHDFTVKKDMTGGMKLTGVSSGEGWTATAELTASAIDVKGAVSLKCPDSWHTIWQTWENPDKLDYIHEWAFYVGGVKAEGYNLDGSIGGMGSDALTFGICYQLNAPAEDMKLVPVYSHTGEHMEEAILLRTE